MSSDDTLGTRIGAVLHRALEAATGEGSVAVEGRHLSDDDFLELATGTLEYLQSRQGQPSRIEGWRRVTVRSAGLMKWWGEAAQLSDRQSRRLAPLRDEVYDLLVSQRLIELDPGRGGSLHVSPAASAAPRSAQQPEPSAPAAFAADQVGAWVLKAAPHVYDLNRVFYDPTQLVRRWAVETDERARAMKAGQPAYLWVSPGDPLRAPGVWGVGQVVGPCLEGVADDGWLDADAARRATVFADVEIVLRDVPIGLGVFQEDERLARAEVILDPWSDNPSFLTPAEAAALQEHLRPVPA